MDFVSGHHGAIHASQHALARASSSTRSSCAPRREIVAAALAHGVVPAHNVSLDLKNPYNVFRDAWRARNDFGFLRMWSIHPVADPADRRRDEARPGRGGRRRARSCSRRSAPTGARSSTTASCTTAPPTATSGSCCRRRRSPAWRCPKKLRRRSSETKLETHRGHRDAQRHGEKSMECPRRIRACRRIMPYFLCALCASSVSSCSSFNSHRSEMTPGAKFRQALQRRKAAAGRRRDQRLSRDPRQGERLSRRSTSRAAAWPRARSALPDLGISNLDDVLTDVRRITDVCDLPLLVDVDTGFGASAFNVARTVKSLIKFGAARDAHRGPGGRQALRPPAGQGARLASRRWSTASRPPSTRAPIRDFFIIARTDALAVRRPRGRDRARRGLRRGRRRRHLPRGDHRPRDVQALQGRGEGARSSPTSPSSARRRSSRSRSCAAPASTSCSTRSRPSAR